MGHSLPQCLKLLQQGSYDRESASQKGQYQAADQSKRPVLQPFNNSQARSDFRQAV